MIGFNQQGITKVWLNDNYSKNHAEEKNKTHDNLVAGQEKNVDHGIQQVLKMVEQRLLGAKFPNKFSSEINSSKFNFF